MERGCPDGTAKAVVGGLGGVLDLGERFRDEDLRRVGLSERVVAAADLARGAVVVVEGLGDDPAAAESFALALAGTQQTVVDDDRVL